MWAYAFISLGQIHRSEMTRLNGRCIFNFLKIVVSPFYVPSSNVWVFLFLLQFPQHLVWSVFSMLAFLIGVCWYLTVVLVCVFSGDQWWWASFNVLICPLYLLERNPLWDIYFTVFIPLCCLSFQSPNSVFWRAEVNKFCLIY